MSWSTSVQICIKFGAGETIVPRVQIGLCNGGLFVFGSPLGYSIRLFCSAELTLVCFCLCFRLYGSQRVQCSSVLPPACYMVNRPKAILYLSQEPESCLLNQKKEIPVGPACQRLSACVSRPDWLSWVAMSVARVGE
jgi:hypothetical protein